MMLRFIAALSTITLIQAVTILLRLLGVST